MLLISSYRRHQLRKLLIQFAVDVFFIMFFKIIFMGIKKNKAQIVI